VEKTTVSLYQSELEYSRSPVSRFIEPARVPSSMATGGGLERNKALDNQQLDVEADEGTKNTSTQRSTLHHHESLHIQP
jgi:hypothetical protein